MLIAFHRKKDRDLFSEMQEGRAFAFYWKYFFKYPLLFKNAL
jgi:hypothetical protein